MSAPIIETDYEFHFTQGEPLFLTVREGRDRVEEFPGHIELEIVPDLKTTIRAKVWWAKLNGISTTRRVFEPEPSEQERLLAQTP